MTGLIGRIGWILIFNGYLCMKPDLYVLVLIMVDIYSIQNSRAACLRNKTLNMLFRQLSQYELEKPAVSGYSDMELEKLDPCYMFIHVWSSILLVFHSDKKGEDSKFPGMMNQYGRLKLLIINV